MADSIEALKVWLEEEDALIGHLKGYIKTGGPVTTFSTTGDVLNVEEHASSAFSVGFAAIVFGPSEETLKDKVLEVFGK